MATAEGAVTAATVVIATGAPPAGFGALERHFRERQAYAVALPPLDGPLDETMERWRRAGELARIRRALEEAAGDRAKAAEALGVPLRRLVQRMRELKL